MKKVKKFTPPIIDVVVVQDDRCSSGWLLILRNHVTGNDVLVDIEEKEAYKLLEIGCMSHTTYAKWE